MLQYKENCGGKDIDLCCFSCWHFPPRSDSPFLLFVAEKVDKDMIVMVEEWSAELDDGGDGDEVDRFSASLRKLVVNEWQ